MYKIYMAEEEYQAPYRVKHAVKGLKKAIEIGKALYAAFVEVRETLPTGKERLVAIIKGGQTLAL